MVFSSTIFLFMFFPITLIIYYLLDKRFRNYFLLIASIIFFSWSQPQNLWIILLNIFVNYVSAILMQKTKIKKLVLAICIMINLGILVYYKYFNFILDITSNILKRNIEMLDIVLPIGISFFTFQGMSYVIDVYKNEVPVQKNPLKVALYIVLFPQLIAGPIVRYKDIVNEIDVREETIDDFSSGAERFIIGLTKKVIIANSMACIVDNIWTHGSENVMIGVAWLGSIAYTLQIFYDFSGYSDMAIGLGRMFGFHFNENFNLPYSSKSITEFWRRWHISLSSWFRDYVYIPLGGNRKRVYLNLAIVFLLTGLWHGASWNFIFWGVWNGFFILIERLLKSKGHPIKQNIFGLIYTLFVVNIGWVFFRAETMSEATKYLCAMFSNRISNGFTLSYYLNRWYVFTGALGLLFASSLPRVISSKICSIMKNRKMVSIKYIMLIFLLYVSILRIVSGTYNPFIYFQF